ncbi:cytochrome P450 [Amycolatopsis japonica]
MSTGLTELDFPFPQPSGFTLPAEFARLRARQPVAKVTLPSGDRAWLVTRYADVRAILGDARFSRAAAERPGGPRMGNTSPGPETILGMDPPDHTRLRRLVAPAFTYRRIEALRPRVEALANELMLDLASGPRTADLLGQFTAVLPSKVIFELLGVPYADFETLHAWTDVIFSLSAHTRDEVRTARAAIERFLVELVGEKRVHPADDLLSVLIEARDEQDRLTETELVSFALILITVGHMSTASTLSTALFTLLRLPELLARLYAAPELVPSAIEELLRHNTFALTGTQLRVALEDVRLGGVTIRAGDAVLAALGSANHDSEVFDRPEGVELARASNPHMAFGYGIHHCLGAQLARLEMQEALYALLRNMPNTLRLAVAPGEIELKTGLTARALASLPVRW